MGKIWSRGFGNEVFERKMKINGFQIKSGRVPTDFWQIRFLLDWKIFEF